MPKQVEIKDSEHSFRLLVEGVLDYAIYMLDPQGLVATWNAGAERMKGYTSEEIIGRHFSQFYMPEDRAAGLPRMVLETAAREGRYEAEGWRIRKDGSRFWASAIVDAIHDAEGRLVGFAKITRDITERRMAQEALRESERQFRLLVNGVTDYALYMLDPNGVVTSWNAGAERIKGYTAHEIIGQNFSRFYTEEDRAAGKPDVSLRMAATQGRFEAEAWRVRKDGSLFWANVVLDSIRDEQGRLLGFAKITRDITERRRAELAVHEAQTQRDRAQRMEALGQLTGGVAHDFNNLLMIISGQIRTLRKLAETDPKARRAVEAVEIATKRGASLTRQLLTFSRRQALNPEVVNMRDRMESFSELVGGSLGPTVALNVEIADDLWPVCIDVNELELALINLTVNARDAIRDSGCVTLAAKNVQLVAEDSPTGLEGPFVAVAVRDTGSGIAPDVLPRVFDPFFTTKPTGKGSGLGLSQVHGFAHQSGGSVLVESALGQGTVVTIYLPRTDKPVEKDVTGKREELSAAGELLLVEDNPEVAEASRALFEQLGYKVQIAHDAETALVRLERQLPEIVVSDIVMPGRFDGLELARAIRNRHPEMPVLLVTGYSNAASSADREFVVLRKPYSAAEFSRAASQVLAGTRR